MRALLRRPEAFVPIAISLALLALIVNHGDVRDADEGTTAHLFQILMPVQVAIIAWFAARWLPRDPRHAVILLAAQCCAALSVVALVFYWRL